MVKPESGILIILVVLVSIFRNIDNACTFVLLHQYG